MGVQLGLVLVLVLVPASLVSAANICMLASSASVLSAGQGVKIRDQGEVSQPDGLLAFSGDANKMLT